MSVDFLSHSDEKKFLSKNEYFFLNKNNENIQSEFEYEYDARSDSALCLIKGNNRAYVE
jgi:hypothetical protein